MASPRNERIISHETTKKGGPQYRRRYSNWLWAERSGDRIPVRARFSAPDQTGPGAHPSSYALGTGSFSGVKRPGRSVDHPPHLEPRLKKEESYTSIPRLGLRGLLQQRRTDELKVRNEINEALEV